MSSQEREIQFVNDLESQGYELEEEDLQFIESSDLMISLAAYYGMINLDNYDLPTSEKVYILINELELNYSESDYRIPLLQYLLENDSTNYHNVMTDLIDLPLDELTQMEEYQGDDGQYYEVPRISKYLDDSLRYLIEDGYPEEAIDELGLSSDTYGTR